MEHVFWITSRAAGTAGLLFASASVGVGLVMAGRLLKGRDLRIVHEALSIATIVAIAVHALSLLGDGYLSPSLADVTIPFVSGYKEPWNSIGIVAGWALAILGLSYYARARIGVQRWRRVHRFASLAWVAAIAHALGEGTDAGTVWFALGTGLAVIPALLLLTVRWSGWRPARAAAQ